MDVLVRPATGEDARAVAEAHVRAWQVAYRDMIPAAFLAALDVDQRTEQWHRNLTETHLPNGTPSPMNAVAELAGAVVGFTCVGIWRDEPKAADMGELWAMYVHPDHWGTGAGYALMGTTIDHFNAQSCRGAYLWVLDENEQARRFYERQGWQAESVTKQDPIGGAQITERRYSIEL